MCLGKSRDEDPVGVRLHLATAQRAQYPLKRLIRVPLRGPIRDL